jgi:2',3'-cyclic-nucleotide 2'-phosphodiesterase
MCATVVIATLPQTTHTISYYKFFCYLNRLPSLLHPIIDIVFFGDLVGKPGRVVVRQAMAQLQAEQTLPAIYIANVENVSHGFGLTEKNYQSLQDIGIDVMTSGNHIWDNKNIFEYIDFADILLRPRNMADDMPGTGARVYEIRGIKVGVINLIGQVFMGSYNSPWSGLEGLIADMKEETPVIFLDFHAEATAEKIALAHYVSHLGVSAMVGTHTHVQTADDRILNHRMGYITDAGFNGTYDSVIGMRPHEAIQRLKSQWPARLEIATGDMLQVNAVRFRVNTQTGVCQSISRINHVLEPLGT